MCRYSWGGSSGSGWGWGSLTMGLPPCLCSHGRTIARDKPAAAVNREPIRKDDS